MASLCDRVIFMHYVILSIVESFRDRFAQNVGWATLY